ncbi:MAG TPA: hypothetical protein VFV49_11530 [Thermoanaerobaculia bacterium]|nr:hypothetical protein [Thermoanaerobaculia bacterium]
MWERTGSVDPRVLADARMQLHWAAQAVAGIGRTLHVPREDDSHTSFTWSATLDALVQEPFNGITAGLRLRDLTLLAIGATASKLPLLGRTLDDAFAFLESQFAMALKRPDVDLPDHPVSRGAAFDANPEHLAELARYYNNAASVLADVARSDSHAGAVRCWPHHFDIATLLTFAGSGEDTRTIGIGFSPGDQGSSEPYYYVTPWPCPDPSHLGALHIGRWNTTGWTGAVLPASSFANVERPEQFVRAFIADATARSREALALT